MNWIYLFLAGLSEVTFTFCLGKTKTSTGTELIFWYTGFAIALIASMLLLMKAIQTIPLGTAYAVWTGIGAAGTAIIGILIFKDPSNFWRLFFITLLIGSVLGLKLVSNK
ncbi:MAG: QacE family quaternary ammonium compound efflux SMR transporter [Chitinophagaceae bacterium]|nr:multidrug efflux SMR transporter [Chitinophagales bacterium]